MDFKHQSVTAMDWNTSASPLDAWLDQSAVPAVTAVATQHSPVNTEMKMIAQETEEIKVFRNVHMAKKQTPKKSLDNIEGLELGAQIFYRSIVDRYPLLPDYLARRLAHANYDQAGRLSGQKARMGWFEIEVQQHVSQAQNNTHPITPVSKMRQDLSQGLSGHEKHRHEWYTEISQFFPQDRDSGINWAYIASLLGRVACILRYHHHLAEREQDEGNTESKGVDGPCAANSNETGSVETLASFPEGRGEFSKWKHNKKFSTPHQSPPLDFWTGNSPNRRPASAHSRSSSMNSSLRGKPNPEPQDQDLTFPAVPLASSSVDLAPKSSLPCPPVESGKVLTFTCLICGSKVQVKTQYEWQ